MESFEKIKSEAIKHRKNKDYDTALELYTNIWNEHRSECGCWEGWGYAYCLRKTGDSNLALDICRDIYKLDQTFKMGKDLYSWCIYDLEINTENDEISKATDRFIKAAKAILKLSDQDDYSPYIRTIFKVVNFLGTRPNVDYDQIIWWLEKLESKQLSTDPKKILDEKGTEHTYYSDRENWASLNTKALCKAERYKDCIEACNKTLKELPGLSYSNKIWIQRRLAVSLAENRRIWWCRTNLYRDSKTKKRLVHFS